MEPKSSRFNADLGLEVSSSGRKSPEMVFCSGDTTECTATVARTGSPMCLAGVGVVLDSDTLDGGVESVDGSVVISVGVFLLPPFCVLLVM